MKTKIWKVFLLLCMVCGLLFSAGCGMKTAEPAQDTAIAQTEETAEVLKEETEEENTENLPQEEKSTAKVDAYQTDPVPADKPKPVEPQTAEVSNTEYHCTISISCQTLLNSKELLDPEKLELVPGDGWVLQPTKVTFYEGENVFQVLQRVCKQQKIHLEFMDTPLYNSAYIEGIYNLYEFDAGDLSGWMYRVNGWFPNYGCSRYQLQDGDVIEWVYTCDLGKDVGGGTSAGNNAGKE